MEARLAMLAALACTAILLLAPPAAAAEVPGARSADSFVDSVGVNTHTFFSDTAYNSGFSVLKSRLIELGVRHIREDLVPERPDQYERLREVAAAGIRSTLILGDPNRGEGELEALASILSGELSGAVEAVEGPNEFDARGGSDWLPRLMQYQRRLYDMVKGDPALASLPVIGPSIVQRRNEEAAGDISSMLDFGNIHPYPDGGAPEGNLDSYLERAAINAGAKPVFATETGYHNALAWGGEHNPTSEVAAATYLPRLFLEYFRRGIARTYAYELVDEKPDPGLEEREQHFGLLRNDLSEKPAFEALRNTLAILSDPGPSFDPAALAYSIGGNRGDLRDVLLQKRDGSFYLALWRARSVWDPSTRTPVEARSEPVTISFGRQLRSVQRYLPNISAEPTPLRARGGLPLTVQVGPQVVILRVEVGAPRRGRIRVWLSRHSVHAGGPLAVRGRLPRQAAGRSLRVKIQRWHGGWRTVGHTRSGRSGVFHKRIRLATGTRRRASRLRVVARRARPSKAVRVRIRY